MCFIYFIKKDLQIKFDGELITLISKMAYLKVRYLAWNLTTTYFKIIIK